MFYIIDQGIRIQTPVETLVRPNNVQALEKAKAVAEIGNDQAINDAQQRQLAKQAQQYNNNEQQSSTTRQPVIFAYQIMTHPVMAITEQESIFNARQILNQHRFHHLPVINQRRELTGIVTDRDIMRYTLNNTGVDLNNIAITTLMSKKVISAAEETEVRSIAEVLCQQTLSAMPITNEHRQLLGIVSRTDILRTLVNQAPLELWA